MIELIIFVSFVLKNSGLLSGLWYSCVESFVFESWILRMSSSSEIASWSFRKRFLFSLILLILVFVLLDV